MENFTFDFTPAMFKIVFCIAAIIQGVKRIPRVADYSHWFPLASCGLGIAFALFSGIADPLFSGVLMGTIASGSYSLLKTGIVAGHTEPLGESLSELDKQLTKERGQHAGSN